MRFRHTGRGRYDDKAEVPVERYDIKKGQQWDCASVPFEPGVARLRLTLKCNQLDYRNRDHTTKSPRDPGIARLKKEYTTD